MNARVRRVGGIALTAALAALLVLFGRHVQWGTVAGAMRDADPALLALAVVLNLLSLALKALRWWVFLLPLGVRSPWLVLRATFAGASLNNLVVAQGGEAARVLLVARGSGVASARVLSALSVERLLDALCYLFLLVGATWLLNVGGALMRWRGIATAVVCACIVGMIALLVLAARRRKRGSTQDLSSPSPTCGRIASFGQRFLGGAAESANVPRIMLGLLLSLVAWALQVATYHLVALAAHLPLPLAGSIAAMLTVGVSFLIRATPGNVGVFQAAYALTVASFGISQSAAVAVALLIQAVQVLPVLGIGMGIGVRRTVGR